MTNPADITSAVATKLRAISALVALVDSTANITAQDQGFPAPTLQEAVRDLAPPAVLVAWRGLVSSRLGLSHSISISIRPKPGTTAGQLISTIIDGVPSGSPVKFLYAELHAALGHPENVTAEIASLLIGDNPPTYLDYPEITFQLTEKRS